MKVRFLKINIMKIYKYIYYHSVSQSSKKNNAPEFNAYSLLSFTQTSNLVTIVNIILIITRIKINYDLRLVAIICPTMFYAVNYYYFTKKGKGSIIMNDRSYCLGKYSYFLNLFTYSSFIFVVISYFFYKEF